MMPPGDGGDTEGWFTESAGKSSFSSWGSSDSSSESESFSEASGGSESETESVTTGTVFVPVPVRELGSESEWSREEKLSKIAEMLKYQQQRHCFIKIDTEPTQPLRVPDVITPHAEPETLAEYERMLHERHGSLPAPEVDRLLAENEAAFLDRALGPRKPAATIAAPVEADDDLFDSGPKFAKGR
jgi:hypothetical protein